MPRPSTARLGALALGLLSAAALHAQVTLTQGAYLLPDRALKSYTLENEFLRLSLVPERGGLAHELIDKRDGYVNLIYLSNKSGSYGGLFDDHGNWNVQPYAARVVAETPERCAIELTGKLRDTTYVKTISLAAGRPMVEVAYRLENAGQNPIGTVLFRNVIRPGGGHVGEADLYVMPLTDGVKRGKGFGRSENIGAPWSALVNTVERRGVSIVYLGDKLRRFYSWEGSHVAPTYEWMFPALEPGTRYATAYCIKVVHGLADISDSTPLYTAHSGIAVAPDRKVKVTTRLSASSVPLAGVRVEFRFAKPGEPRDAAAATLDFGDVAVDTVKENACDWTAPSDGAWVLECVLSSAGKEIGRYEEVFGVGKTTKASFAGYSRQVRWAAADPVEAVPGWKKIERYTLQPSAADKDRGYFLFDEFGPDAGKDVAAFAVDVGIGERESVSLNLAALKDIGAVRLSVKAGTLPAANLRVTAAEPASHVNWGRTFTGHKLLGQDTLPTKSGEKAFLWLLYDGAGLAPGEYSATVVLAPEKAPPKEMTFTVRVAPVRLPEDLLVFFNPSCLFNYLASSGKPAEAQWDERKGRQYGADMRAHGVRVCNFSALSSPGRDLKKVKLRATGEPLMEAIQKNPAAFREGPLPALDLGHWDWMINLALEYDQYVAKTTLGNEENYEKDFLDVSRVIYGKKDLSADSPEHARVRQWLLGAIPVYMREKGYRRLNATIGDEIPFDRFAKWAEKAAEARRLGFGTGVTTSLATLSNPEALKLLGSQSEFWVIGTLNDDLLRAARKAGVVKPADWVETYCSSANYWQSYETMRRWAGWWPAYFELDAVWIQEYWRWNRDASVIFPDEKEGPRTSGAWEGCYDGLEDANYYYMALDIVKLLESQPATAALGKQARAELESISGKNKDSLVAFEYEKTPLGLLLACKTTDSHAFRQAKRKLLDFIARYGAQTAGRCRPVKWGETVIARDGAPLFAVAHGEGLEKAASGLAAWIDARSGRSVAGGAPAAAKATQLLRLDKVALPGAPAIAVVTGRDKAFLDRLAAGGVTLPVTALYPAPGSYVIHQTGESLIVIYGGDVKGAELGAANAARFIRSVRAETPRP
jgi:hypothetical protein